MEETQRIQRSQKGHRAHLTKVLNKATTIMENDEAPKPCRLLRFTATIEQLARKRTVLNELNEKLLAMVKDPDELEQEIMEAEDIECEINEKSAQISAFVLSCNTVKNPVIPQVNAPQVITSPQQVNACQVITSPQQVSAPQVITPPQQDNSPQTIPSLQVSESQPTTSSTLEVNPLQTPPLNQEQSVTLNKSEGVSSMNTSTNTGNLPMNYQSNPVSPTSQPHLTPTPNHVSRLPKLNLPTFSGTPLTWNTFWDSFNVAVNSNPNLEGVQKCNYLQDQLSGDAASAIAGFPLTNNNYKQAVDLLKTRFGEPQKIINNNMQALLNLPNPSNDLTNLQQFYDSMETHVRGLASLGKSQESYGDLLIPTILGKLPNNLR